MFHQKRDGIIPLTKKAVKPALHFSGTAEKLKSATNGIRY